MDMTAPIQFFLIWLLCTDEDVTITSGLLCSIFLVDILPISDTYYYSVHFMFDLMILGAIFSLKSITKLYIISLITICSLVMNVYEGISYYQTIIYPYRDVIQWWMVESMFIVLAWNCNWRGIDNVKLCRTDN